MVVADRPELLFDWDHRFRGNQISSEKNGCVAKGKGKTKEGQVIAQYFIYTSLHLLFYICSF